MLVKWVRHFFPSKILVSWHVFIIIVLVKCLHDYWCTFITILEKNVDMQNDWHFVKNIKGRKIWDLAILTTLFSNCPDPLKNVLQKAEYLNKSWISFCKTRMFCKKFTLVSSLVFQWRCLLNLRVMRTMRAETGTFKLTMSLFQFLSSS